MNSKPTYHDHIMRTGKTRKEYEQEYRKKRREAGKKKIHALLGNKCNACGAKENEAELVISIKRGTKNKITSISLHYMAEERMLKLLPGFELLCRNKHKGKVGRIAHGTYFGACTKKCTCDLCEEFKANLSLQKKEDYRAMMAAKKGQQCQAEQVVTKEEHPGQS